MEQLNLNLLTRPGGPGKLHDTKYMSAAEKRRVLRHWEAFLKSGCQREKFTKPLYHHLMQHCMFIAHYDLQGFYSTYFERGDDIRHFLSQFDNRKGIPKSIEYGMTAWLTDEDYYDINIEMCRIASKYIPVLELKAQNDQRHMDLAAAKTLLNKHNIEVPQALEEI